nr:immunoglobulin light chain junction region [Macaca mulatta]MOW53756.1 immunoglobulin light chain junction region [Macaca mulatta]MOX26417.1 immunoglobulin light chain junction region [Macaca mulatta]MOX97664.1 immunoglobulin light chain junction region [Macaca mulatta]MOX99116.1 immunoglobulin light chain junction region [Macaca mulatta]
CMQAPEFPWTF